MGRGGERGCLEVVLFSSFSGQMDESVMRFFLGGGAYQIELNLPFQEPPTDPKLMAQGRSSPQRSVMEN